MIAFLFRELDLDLHDCWISSTVLDISRYVHLGSAPTTRGRGGGNNKGGSQQIKYLRSSLVPGCGL